VEAPAARADPALQLRALQDLRELLPRQNLPDDVARTRCQHALVCKVCVGGVRGREGALWSVMRVSGLETPCFI
jgi:hypothetical protein